jgi:nitrite transporter NirC
VTGATVEAAAASARAKYEYLKSNPFGYFILSALAGVYIGFAIVLVFAIGAPLSAAGSPFTKTVMGASFGIALALVIFAGSELFTGNNMVMTVGLLKRQVPAWSVAAVWGLSWIGNLVGGLGLAWLVMRSGIFGAAPQLPFIEKTVETKMHLASSELFFRGILCNWLVCLAVWTAMRSTSEAGKLIMIFWCLFAFIGAGFEHSVANMTLLGLGLLLPHSEYAITWGGFVHNLVPVTLGNIVGGGVFVGFAYWLSNETPGFLAIRSRPNAGPGAALDAPAGLGE